VTYPQIIDTTWLMWDVFDSDFRLNHRVHDAVSEASK